MLHIYSCICALGDRDQLDNPSAELSTLKKKIENCFIACLDFTFLFTLFCHFWWYFKWVIWNAKFLQQNEWTFKIMRIFLFKDSFFDEIDDITHWILDFSYYCCFLSIGISNIVCSRYQENNFVKSKICMINIT